MPFREAMSDDRLSTARARSDDSENEGQPAFQPDIKCHVLNGLGGAHLHTMTLDAPDRSIGFMFGIAKNLIGARSCKEFKLIVGEAIWTDEHLYANFLGQVQVQQETPEVYIYIITFHNASDS